MDVDLTFELSIYFAEITESFPQSSSRAPARQPLLHAALRAISDFECSYPFPGLKADRCSGSRIATLVATGYMKTFATGETTARSGGQCRRI